MSRARTGLLLLIVVASCAAPPPPDPRPLDPEVEAIVARATRAVDGGDPRAGDVVAELLARYPDSVDGRRLLQNLRMQGGEDWTVSDEAREAWERSPDDPALLYLYARTVPDREVQGRLFRQATELDPSFYFGHYGLGVALLERGELEPARDAFVRALAVRPGDAQAKVLLAKTLAAMRKPEEASETLAEVQAEHPGNVLAAITASQILSRSGRSDVALLTVLGALDSSPTSPRLLVRAYRLLGEDGGFEHGEWWAALAAEAALAEDPGSPAALLLRSRLRRRAGDPAGALADLEAAVAAGAADPTLRGEGVSAAIEAGAYGRARDAFFLGLPSTVLSERNERLHAIEELGRALAAAEAKPRDAEALGDLARALSGSGFESEAALVAARALAEAPDDESLQALVADLDAWARFLEEVRRTIRACYRTFERGGEGQELESVLARLSAASRRILGRDALADLDVTTYSFVGGVASTDGGNAPEFSSRGALLVVGRRKGGPTEATLARLTGRFPDAREREVPYTLVTVSGRTLRSFSEGVRSNIAGFTMPGWILLDLDIIGVSAGQMRRVAATARDLPLRPADDPERRASLWFTQGVRARLAKRQLETAGGEDGVLSAVLTHELGHLMDADRYVPFGSNLPSLFWQAARHGFSISAMEVTLERNAEAYSLRHAPYRWSALVSTTAFLPYEGSSPPHSRAYHQLVEALVRGIEEEPERYPSIDREYSILGQLDRLTDAELGDLISRTLD